MTSENEAGDDYDVIVLGGGAPGEHCAGALAEGGLRVAVVERDLVGGECSYWACIPSKTLLRPGEAVHGAREAAGIADVDVKAALAWRDFMVSDYSDAGQERWLADRSIDLVRGTGRLAGVGVVEVDGVRHTATHVVIATGSDPVVPPIPGLRELEGVWGTREATGMKSVPGRLIVLGGGPAGVELSQVVRRLGGEVVLVESAERVLSREAAPLGEALGEVLRRDGIELVLGAEATEARREGDDYVLKVGDGREFRGDHLLVATGRRPRVDNIGLETVDAEWDGRGIRVDEHLRVSDRVWAIGDVNGIWPLTYVGEYQGDIVAANILGDPRPANYESVPRVVFTDPQAAAVGASDAPFSGTAPIREISKMATYSHAYAESNGFLTLLSDGERLTGAYGLGPEAAEWMQQATLAIRARVPLDLLRDTIQPFPSFSEIYALALKALDRDMRGDHSTAKSESVRAGVDEVLDLGSRRHVHVPGVNRGSVVEFLVEFVVKVPTGIAEPEVEQREEAEAAAAAKLFDQGHLERLWRMSAASSGDSILGLYCAASATELNDLLSALPMYEWMDVDVTPLQLHPNDPAQDKANLVGEQVGDHACRMGRGVGKEYLVSMTTHVPEGTTAEAVDAMRAREAVRSGELAAQGHLLRLWRPPLEPGEWRTLGLFAADDDAHLEKVLVSMPLRIWRTDTVTALSSHPNDPARISV